MLPRLSVLLAIALLFCGVVSAQTYQCTRYYYDKNGRLESTETDAEYNSVMTCTFGYDSLNRVVTERHVSSRDSVYYSSTVTYYYSDGGKNVKATTTYDRYPGEESVRYLRKDGSGNVLLDSTVKNGKCDFYVVYTYRDTMCLTRSLSACNGIVGGTTYTYDKSNRLTEYTETIAGVYVYRFVLHYDANGRHDYTTKYMKDVNGTMKKLGVVEERYYDGKFLERVVGKSTYPDESPSSTTEYTYDESGAIGSECYVESEEE